MLLRELLLCQGLENHAESSLQNGKVGSILATVNLNYIYDFLRNYACKLF